MVTALDVDVQQYGNVFNAATDTAHHFSGEAVRLLSYVDPHIACATHGNVAIWFASINRNTEVAMSLLADPRVDPTADDNAAIRLASLNEWKNNRNCHGTIPCGCRSDQQLQERRSI
jgi:hypothetical protein